MFSKEQDKPDFLKVFKLKDKCLIENVYSNLLFFYFVILIT